MRERWSAGGRPKQPEGQRDSRLIDYDVLELSSRQWLAAALFGALLMSIVAWVFYRELLAIILFAPLGLLFPGMWRKRLIARRKAQLKLQFKQLLSTVSSALGAGRSIESAIRESLSDLRLLYPDGKSPILQELAMIIHRMDNGESVESALFEFAGRAKLEELSQFAQVFVICKRTGGNLVQVVRRTSLLIQEKLEIELDLQVTLAQKRFESKLLSAAPIVFVAIMAWSAPDYMEPLYGSLVGVFVMTGAIGVMALCQYWIQHIMNIKV
ncbi:type II secretion system F family protein [Paenibacillus sp. YYML68]|uniref:type II secretion system F family protein n=1 Tax=Paenibacillus sp. YYML68 TaxID=2909250 RepID=UPI00248F4814|nr:type II secretion system F family protein [Paenibacillus sp. YYML68]